MSATISLLFGLLVAIVVLATLATRLRLPYAILLVIGGLLLGFIPGLPSIALNPELVLVLFLPPLIYSSAWLTSWREFRANLRPILLDVSTLYSIPLKEDRFDPHLRKMRLKITERRAMSCTIPPVASSPCSSCFRPGRPSVVQS